VTQLAEVTENTRRGARGLILPAVTAPGNPGENALLPDSVAEMERLGLRPREVAVDGAFMLGPTNTSADDLEPERVFIPARQQPGSDAPNAACSATAPEPRDESATSNAATGWTAAARRARTASRSGPAGRASPTTSTRSSSGPAERLPTAPTRATRPLTRTAAPPSGAAVSLSQELFRSKAF
jgi:hypothetical protein